MSGPTPPLPFLFKPGVYHIKEKASSFYLGLQENQTSVQMTELDDSNPLQKWRITIKETNPKSTVVVITSHDGQSVLSWEARRLVQGGGSPKDKSSPPFPRAEKPFSLTGADGLPYIGTRRVPPFIGNHIPPPYFPERSSRPTTLTNPPMFEVYALVGRPVWNQTKWILDPLPSTQDFSSGPDGGFDLLTWVLPGYHVVYLDKKLGTGVGRPASVFPEEVLLVPKSSTPAEWAFELVTENVPILFKRPTFQQKYFPITPNQAQHGRYDIIIVGSGIGGGVLAQDLYKTNFKVGPKRAKRILVLEKGDLLFHSHCFNAARPSGPSARTRQNDTFFETFRGQHAKGSAGDWHGGPMYNLGGRSATWGLFIPRIREATLKETFHKNVTRALLGGYYDAAERLMNLQMPKTKTVHQHVMDQLNIDWTDAILRETSQESAEQTKSQKDFSLHWQWARIASEFQDERNFEFPQGAYSTIDHLLEIAMTQQKNLSGLDNQLDSFKTILDAEVRSINFDSSSRATGVNVAGPNGELVSIGLNPKGKVVLAAGSINSPAILLRSVLEGDKNIKHMIPEHGGLRLTDHYIISYSCSFRHRNPEGRATYGSMKLQTYVNLGNRVALANAAIDASLFLPRGYYTQDDNLPKFGIVFLLETPLSEKPVLELDNDEPKIISPVRGGKVTDHEKGVMGALTASAMNSLHASMGIEFIGHEGVVEPKNIKLQILPAGAVAHEVGSLPMISSKGGSEKYCLNENLRVVRDLCSGVYVCDNSCFPYSPHANPSLTLSALALRLSKHLHNPLRRRPPPPDETTLDTVTDISDGDSDYDNNHPCPFHVVAMNQSGSIVKVALSNIGSQVQDFDREFEIKNEADRDKQSRKDANSAEIPTEAQNGDRVEDPIIGGNTGGVVVLEPGDEHKWIRVPGTVESLFIYKLDRAAKQIAFLKEPVLMPAHPGEVTYIT